MLYIKDFLYFGNPVTLCRSIFLFLRNEKTDLDKYFNYIFPFSILILSSKLSFSFNNPLIAPGTLIQDVALAIALLIPHSTLLFDLISPEIKPAPKASPAPVLSTTLTVQAKALYKTSLSETKAPSAPFVTTFIPLCILPVYQYGVPDSQSTRRQQMPLLPLPVFAKEWVYQ